MRLDGKIHFAFDSTIILMAAWLDLFLYTMPSGFFNHTCLRLCLKAPVKRWNWQNHIGGFVGDFSEGFFSPQCKRQRWTGTMFSARTVIKFTMDVFFFLLTWIILHKLSPSREYFYSEEHRNMGWANISGTYFLALKMSFFCKFDILLARTGFNFVGHCMGFLG